MAGLTRAEQKMLDALNAEHGTKYKGSQLMEWSTGKVEAQEGEEVYYVKEFGVYIAIKK